MTVERIRQLLTAKGEKPLVIGFIFLLVLGTIAAGLLGNDNVAYAVLVAGEQVALIEEPDEVDGVLEQLVAARSEEVKTVVKPVQEIEIIPTRAKGEKIPADQLAFILADRLEFVTAGVAIIIDGEQRLVVESEAVAEQLLSEAKGSYVQETDSLEVVSLVTEEEIGFKLVEVGLDRYDDYSKALALLLSGTERVEKHKVVPGDTLWGIANVNKLRVEELKAANPQLKSDLLKIGDELNLVKLDPLINVVATVKQSKREAINFKTKYVNDSSMYRGQEKVKQAGARGEREVVYQLVQVNGVTVNKDELEAKIIKSPTERLVNRGTKVIVASRGSGDTGKLGWPVNGRITSPFGRRGSGYHYGVDLAAPLGTAIRSANGGTVIFVGWYAGYGNMIDIDHGNGVSTRYAHNSANLVKVGQQVKAGEVIARVGNTGKSTGPHVHFEVRTNGQPKNPLNYLP